MSVTAEIGPLRLQSGHLLHIRCEDPKPPTNAAEPTCENLHDSQPADAPFRRGDVVQLKSGGPVMTIETAGSHDTYDCVWFSGNDQVGFASDCNTYPFHRDVLQRVS